MIQGEVEGHIRIEVGAGRGVPTLRVRGMHTYTHA